MRGDAAQSTPLLLRGDKPYAITVWDLRGISGTVIVLADDRLFTNASLAVGDNAALLSRILNGGGKTVDLAGAYSGLVAATPVDSITRGRLAPFMAQLMLCLILFFLMRGIHFGRPRDADPLARRRFAEHVRAVGLQYARAHAGEHALQSYGAWATERLRARVRLRGDRGLGDLAAAVAARTGKPVGDVARLLFEARRDPNAAAAIGGRSTRATAEPYLAMMRELESLVADSGAVAARAGRADPRRARDPIPRHPTAKLRGETNTVNAFEFRDRFARLVNEISRVVVGQDELVKQTLIAVLARGPRPDRRRARAGQDAAGADAGPGAGVRRSSASSSRPT